MDDMTNKWWKMNMKVAYLFGELAHSLQTVAVNVSLPHNCRRTLASEKVVRCNLCGFLCRYISESDTLYISSLILRFIVAVERRHAPTANGEVP